MTPTLSRLQADARARIFDRPAFARACSSDRSPTSDEEACCDALIADAVRWLAKHKPRRNHDRRDDVRHERMERWMRKRVERGKVRIPQSGATPVGVGLIMGALLSWLIGRVIDFVWDWWTRTEKAPEFACGMVTDLPELEDDDE